jgi:hypothetical protein
MPRIFTALISLTFLIGCSEKTESGKEADPVAPPEPANAITEFRNGVKMFAEELEGLTNGELEDKHNVHHSGTHRSNCIHQRLPRRKERL